VREHNIIIINAVNVYIKAMVPVQNKMENGSDPVLKESNRQTYTENVKLQTNKKLKQALDVISHQVTFMSINRKIMNE